jgi:hypothetical protein
MQEGGKAAIWTLAGWARFLYQTESKVWSLPKQKLPWNQVVPGTLLPAYTHATWISNHRLEKRTNTAQYPSLELRITESQNPDGRDIQAQAYVSLLNPISHALPHTEYIRTLAHTSCVIR